MKTYEDCLDEVARNRASQTWADYKRCFYKYTEDLETAHKEAALLYGEQKWNEACEEMRSRVMWAWDDAPRSEEEEYQHMSKVDKPPFKP